MTRQEKVWKEFELKLFSLKDTKHQFAYSLGKEFFETFEFSPIQEGAFEVKMELDKKENLLTLNFDIQGNTQLECDRSLEQYDFPIQKKTKMVYKYGEMFEEVSDELIILENGTTELNIADLLYQLIAVEIPYKKLHPKFQDSEKEWDEEEEIELVYSDSIQSEENEEVDENSKEFFEQLKKKFNKE